jgi:hypothetical protein
MMHDFKFQPESQSAYKVRFGEPRNQLTEPRLLLGPRPLTPYPGKDLCPFSDEAVGLPATTGSGAGRARAQHRGKRGC